MFGPVMIWSLESPSTSESLGTKGVALLCSTTGWRPPAASAPRGGRWGVGEEGRRAVGLDDRVAPAGDEDAAPVRDLGAAVAQLRGGGGEGGDHVDDGDGAGHLLELGGRLLDGGPGLAGDP